VKKNSILFFLLIAFTKVFSATYSVNPSNYTTFISSLAAGDTILFTAGNYLNGLSLNNISGTSGNEIVFIGTQQSSVVFIGNACCNTVSLTQCAYLVFKNFTLDGQSIPNVDGIKAEGSANNWTHHITIDSLHIIGHSGNQQTVGISTKCPSWDWWIKNNVIDGAGTGLYLGNSTWNEPLINSLIENNLVMNSIGYCMEIKHENVGVRTAPGMPQSGFTIIRRNVFCKANNSSTGGNARPNVLLGYFPASGNGSTDYYEVYGNFFYNNPVEALFQATGNVTFYNNICVNNDANGWGVQIREHNSFQPRSMNIFHNTIVVASGTGLNFYNCNTGYTQYAYGNAVFASPNIQTNTTIQQQGNLTGNYSSASTYLTNPFLAPPSLSVFPLVGQISGFSASSTPFQSFQEWDKDFNGTTYNWSNYAGSYSAEGINSGWQLDCGLITNPTAVEFTVYGLQFIVYPNPSNGRFNVIASEAKQSHFEIYNSLGNKIHQLHNYSGSNVPVDLSSNPDGIYFLQVRNENGELIYSGKLIKQ